MILRQYAATAGMSAREAANAGAFYLAPQYLLQAACLVPRLALWRTLLSGGADVGMTLPQMLTYTYVGTLLSALLAIETPLSGWLYDGLALSLYQRPMNLLGNVAAQTLGKMIPRLALFSLPMALLSPLLGISLVPASLWVIPCLVLCVSLGFAIDFLFACLLIRMMNARYVVYSLRHAVSGLLSGSFIPFLVLPWGMGEVLKYQPLGSLGGAVLSVYTGTADPVETVLVQLIWNLILWPCALVAFRRASERMVSHGG